MTRDCRRKFDSSNATYSTADGDYGIAWALGINVAHRLGYTPPEIHARTRESFGITLVIEGSSYKYGVR